MGLHSDPKYGVKAQLRARFPHVFSVAPTLVDAAQGVRRARVVAVLDGNVVAHHVTPTETKTFAEYAGVVCGSLAAAATAACLVVVAFDDPARVTAAKTEEQARRDAGRASSIRWMRGDDYGVDELRGAADVVPLIQCRAARMRCLDEVAVASLQEVQRDAATAGVPELDGLREAFVGGALVYDGVDAKGASRGGGVPRCPDFCGTPGSTHSFRANAFGEADLKLVALLRDIERSEVADIALVVTTDQDAICLEVLERARRNGEDACRGVRRLICARQRSKRDRAGCLIAAACYQCIDVSTLYDALVGHLWGLSHPLVADVHAGLLALVAAWALCGCDFVRLKGLRADVVLDVLPELLHSPLVESADWVLEGDGSDVRNALVRPLQRILSACAQRLHSMPRMARQAAQVATAAQVRPTDPALLRAAWTTAYWSLNELHDLAAFGFPLAEVEGVVSSTSDVDEAVRETVDWLVAQIESEHSG